MNSNQNFLKWITKYYNWLKKYLITKTWKINWARSSNNLLIWKNKNLASWIKLKIRTKILKLLILQDHWFKSKVSSQSTKTMNKCCLMSWNFSLKKYHQHQKIQFKNRHKKNPNSHHNLSMLFGFSLLCLKLIGKISMTPKSLTVRNTVKP